MMENAINNGTIGITGINANVSLALGNKLVDQFMQQVSTEDMGKLIEYVSSDLFKTADDGSVEVKTGSASLFGFEANPTIAELIKKEFNTKIKEELKKKCNEIIQTTDYQDKIESIATELVEYATEGYKVDMKCRIKERLVSNVLCERPSYSGVDLKTIINQCIDSRLN